MARRAFHPGLLIKDNEMSEPHGAKAGKIIRKGMKAVIVASVFFLAGSLFPSKAGAELALGAAQDFIHAKNTQPLLLRYDFRTLKDGAYTMAWQRSDTITGALGADFNLGYSIVDINLGGVYLPETGEINGTRWNFSLRAAINLGERYRVELLHFSNGKRVFRWLDDKNNAGWNFLAVSYRF